MFWNNVRVSIRHIKKRKALSFFNIVGFFLAISIMIMIRSMPGGLANHIGQLMAFIVVLLLLCVGVNLLASQYRTGLKAIGVRKSLGATKLHIFLQVISEMIISAVAAGLISVVTIDTFKGALNQYFHITVLFLESPSGGEVLFLLGAMVFSGFFAGAYPALILSRVTIIKGIRHS